MGDWKSPGVVYYALRMPATYIILELYIESGWNMSVYLNEQIVCTKTKSDISLLWLLNT